MRYYSPFPVAIPQRRARSHALLTRPPLDPKVSLDLHVLGLPPAFVLSQDQTLKFEHYLPETPKRVGLDESSPCTSFTHGVDDAQAWHSVLLPSRRRLRIPSTIHNVKERV